MFATRRRTLSLLLIVSLGHVLLISVQVQSKGGLPLVESVPFALFAQVEKIIGGVTGGLSGLWGHYFALVGVARQNEALTRRVAELEGGLRQEEAVARRTRSLEEALDFQQSLALQTIAARVIAFDPSADFLTVTIDRGSADGVEADLAVIAPQGIVGRIINHPTTHAAQVQLLIGRTAAAGGSIERADAGGIVKGGSGDPPLLMDYVSNIKDVKPGDEVVTSGQDGIYPPGLPIGTVEKAERGSGLYREIRLKPAVDATHLSIVLVVLDRPERPEKTAQPPVPRTAAPTGRGRSTPPGSASGRGGA